MSLPFRRTSDVSRSFTSAEQEMYGKLGSVSLHDLLQMLALTQRTATVKLDQGGRTGSVLLKEGLMLHAETHTSTGEEALVKLLGWKDAAFVVAEGIHEPEEPSIQRAVDAVMLEVLSRLDETNKPSNVTPFPFLERDAIEDEDLVALARTSVSKRLKPPPPRSALARHEQTLKWAGGALAVLAGLAIAGSLLGVSLFDVGTPPAADLVGASPSADGRRSQAMMAAMNPWATMNRSDAEADLLANARATMLTAEESVNVSAPMPGLGQVVVLVEPWGEVSVDGEPVGVTPFPALELDAGAHLLTVSNPSYVGKIRHPVDVRAGETYRVNLSFKRSGSLRVLVTPWADVEIDGQSVGQTPMGELQVTPGTHEVVLTHPELGTQNRTIEIVEGATSRLEVDLR